MNDREMSLIVHTHKLATLLITSPYLTTTFRVVMFVFKMAAGVVIIMFVEVKQEMP